MNPENKTMKPWFARRAGVLLVLGTCAPGCAKTDVQAPAKEAPTSVAPSDAVMEEGNEAAPAAEAVAPAPPVEQDKWPQAERAPAAKPASPKSEDALGAAGSKGEPGKDEQKRDDSERERSKKASPARAGAATQGAAAPEPALSLSESLVELQLQWGHFEQAISLAVPDCAAAERFRQNVCTLAGRICALEQNLPSTTPRRCEDGQRRCSDATTRYRDKCDS